MRLPEAAVEYLDGAVAAGAPSRASVVTRALEREMRRSAAERDAAILAARGSADDLDDLVAWSADLPVNED